MFCGLAAVLGAALLITLRVPTAHSTALMTAAFAAAVYTLVPAACDQFLESMGMDAGMCTSNSKPVKGRGGRR